MVGLAAILVTARRVESDEMAWSIQEGDYVWVLPDRIRRGDVVVLRDPLDPSRTVLRRALGAADQKVRYDEDGVRLNGKRLRQTDMGDGDGYRVLKEVLWSSPPARPNPFLVRYMDKTVRWELPEKVLVPEGHWYLLADDRDGAMDSRWWGPDGGAPPFPRWRAARCGLFCAYHVLPSIPPP